MRTPIQQAIEALQIEMQKATEQHSPNIASGFHHSIIILQSFLPTEKEAIKEAYKEGCMYYSTAFPKEHYTIDAEFYYQETYPTT